MAQIMGMPMVLDLRDECDDNAELAALVFDWLETVDRRFSTYRPDSDVSRINAGEIAVADCHPDVRAILSRCDELREATGGYFDARYRSLEFVDPSGLVKGWAVDRATALLDRQGRENYSLNAAGDIRMRGGALPAPTWRTGIQHPGLADRVAAVVECSDLAVATSGDYARGEHVFDPHTGAASHGIASATVCGADLATADAYATAAFAMGREALDWVRTIAPYEAFLIVDDEVSFATPGFPLADRRS